jgi:hypothetical protein
MLQRSRYPAKAGSATAETVFKKSVTSPEPLFPYEHSANQLATLLLEAGTHGAVLMDSKLFVLQSHLPQPLRSMLGKVLTPGQRVTDQPNYEALVDAAFTCLSARKNVTTQIILPSHTLARREEVCIHVLLSPLQGQQQIWCVLSYGALLLRERHTQQALLATASFGMRTSLSTHGLSGDITTGLD